MQTEPISNITNEQKYVKQFAFSDQISSRIPIGIAAGFA